VALLTPTASTLRSAKDQLGGLRGDDALAPAGSGIKYFKLGTPFVTFGLVPFRILTVSH
jgi:hypothetical protein